MRGHFIVENLDILQSLEANLAVLEVGTSRCYGGIDRGDNSDNKSIPAVKPNQRFALCRMEFRINIYC